MTDLPSLSTLCFHGQPVPVPLRKVLAAGDDADDPLGDCEIELLTSLTPLDAGYGDHVAAESASIAANVRAHRRLFQRIGFFAEDGDGGFIGFHLDTENRDDPPVVQLDSEGQYRWLGITLGDALLRLADDLGDVERMGQWLRALEITTAPLKTVGATTQFLPSLQDLQERWYYEELGTPRRALDSSVAPAVPNNPNTWLLRPGAEVAGVLRSLLGVAAGDFPDKQWVACDGDGRVNTIWLQRVGATASTSVLGFGFGAIPSQIEASLGPPQRRGGNWLRYEHGVVAVRFGFTQGNVDDIYLGVLDEVR